MDKAQLKKARVLVAGDAMLDRYWFGDAERISPEAPVPVVRVTRTEERLGGAANVARNIASVGASSTPFPFWAATKRAARLKGSSSRKALRPGSNSIRPSIRR